MQQPIAVFCVNEGRKQNAKQTRADFRAVKRHPPTIGWPKLIGFQEIDEADLAPERDILEKVFRRGFRLVSPHTRVPIAVSKRLKVSDRKRVDVSEGIPGVSPARILTTCVVHTAVGPVGFIDGHAVSGAWNKDTHERAEEERDEAWEDYAYACNTMIRSYLKQGISVFRVGDDNRMGGYSMHRHEQVQERAGVVLITFTPAQGGVEFVRDAMGKMQTHSDHPVPWVRGHLRPPS